MFSPTALTFFILDLCLTMFMIYPQYYYYYYLFNFYFPLLPLHRLSPLADHHSLLFLFIIPHYAMFAHTAHLLLPASYTHTRSESTEGGRKVIKIKAKRVYVLLHLEIFCPRVRFQKLKL